MTRLALAYLFRRPVQILAVLGVAIGLLALLVVLAVMNGLIEQDRASVRGPLSDLLLIPADSVEPAQYADYQRVLSALPEVEAVAPHLIAYALLASGNRSVQFSGGGSADVNGVQVVGIDVEAEIAATYHQGGFSDMLAQARQAPVDPQQPFAYAGENYRSNPGALISDRVARLRRLGGPDRLDVLNLVALPYRIPDQDEELRPSNQDFVVAGTYQGSDYEMSLDRIYVLRRGPWKGLHDTLVGRAAPDFSEALIKLRPGVDYEQGRSAVLAGLARAGLPEPGGADGGALQTWEERRSLFLQAINNERRVTTLVMFFIVVVAAFGIFATLSALVREKVRDLGILAALGFSPARRAALLLIIGSLGSGAGAVLGYLGARNLVHHHLQVEDFLRDRLGIEVFRSDLYVIDGIPVLWDSNQALFLSLCAFFTGVLFTLGPALRAASLSPVEALRYE